MSLLSRAGLVVALLGAASFGCDRAEPSVAVAEPLPLAEGLDSPSAVTAAGSGTASPVAEAAPSDAGSADASADGAAAAPLPPAIVDDPPSAEKSKAPTKKEWAAAPAVRVARVTDKACSAKRLREWVRVTCTRYYHSISVVSGTREALDLNIDGENGNAYVAFPVRRGNSRLIMLQRQTKWSGSPDVLISEQWLEGDKGPLISILGIH